MPQALETADEKFLIDYHHDGREQQLRQPHGDVIVRVKRGQRPAPHHVAHREIHQHYQKTERPEEPTLQLWRFMVFQLRLRVGWIHGGFAALDGGAVSRFLHRGDDRVVGCRAFDAHRIGQQADGARRHAGHLGNGLLYARAARCAAHAGYVELLHFFHAPCCAISVV